MEKQRTGFTLIELLVVISTIALLVGILLPALSSARRSARQMKSNTQLRGIHQAKFMYSEEHDGFYPGVDASSNAAGSNAAEVFTDESEMPTLNAGASPRDTWAGAFIKGRFILLLHGKYVAPEYLESPAEINTNFTLWDPTATYGATTASHMFSSYALPVLKYGANDPDKVRKPRVDIWTSSELDSSTPSASDRLMNGSDQDDYSTGHQSLWSAAGAPWKGGMVFTDNHVEVLNDSTISKKIRMGDEVKPDGLRDNIFSQSLTTTANVDDLSGLGTLTTHGNVQMAVNNLTNPAFTSGE